MHNNKNNTTGLIHIYTGDGKGKTTAAVGLAVRARGAELHVGFYQFMKGRPSAEISMLEKLGIETFRDTDKMKFVFQMTNAEKEKYQESQNRLLKHAIANADNYDVLILDELASAISTDMVPENETLTFLDGKPAGLEVIITGRDVGEELVARANYISNIQCRKHPFESGVAARKGIEF